MVKVKLVKMHYTGSGIILKDLIGNYTIPASDLDLIACLRPAMK